MNIAKRNTVLQELEAIPPTDFYKVYDSFWADALHRYINKLPKKHRRNRLISIEAVHGFEDCLCIKASWDFIEKQS